MLAVDVTFDDPFSFFPPQEKSRKTESETNKNTIAKRPFLNIIASKNASND